jgi:hypothetical protein
MGGEGLAEATRRLVYLLAALYVLAVLTAAAFGEIDTAGEAAAWIGVLGGGATLLVLGQRFAPPGWRRAAVVSLGAMLGGLALVWTIIVPIAAAVVVTCAVTVARRGEPSPA